MGQIRSAAVDRELFTVDSPPPERLGWNICADKCELTIVNVQKRLAAAGIETEVSPATNPEFSKRMHCTARRPVPLSDWAAVAFVDGLVFDFDDPDLDLDKVSEALGSPVTPWKEVCDAGSASAATMSAPPLVGTDWYTTGGPGRPCDGNADGGNMNWFGPGFFLTTDGTWNQPYCQSGGTYEVNGDTITWLGGSDCDAGVKGIYRYTLTDDRLTQVVVDDPCGPRRAAYDGVTYTAIT